MKTKFLWMAILGLTCLFLSAGCRWFADNPMFPTAKVAITFQVLCEDGSEVRTNQLGILPVTTVNQTSEESSSMGVTQAYTLEITTTTTEGTSSTSTTSQNEIEEKTEEIREKIEGKQEIKITFARSVKFTFNPRNAVGGQIEKCTVEYYDGQGNLISALKKVLTIFVDIPADTSKSATVTLEIFDKEVEDYYLSHNLISGYAVMKFEGTDYAGHSMTFKASVPISVYLPQVEIESIDVSAIGTTSGTCATCSSCR
ncbi:MAG: hypothetical protein ACUVTO_04085 [Candidatus Caldatribacteriaceae bacterium]